MKWSKPQSITLEKCIFVKTLLVLGPNYWHFTSEHIVTLTDTDAAASRLQLCTIIRTVGDGIFHPLSFIQITHLYTLLFVLLIFIHTEKPHTSAYVYSFTHIYINTEIHTRNPIRKKIKIYRAYKDKFTLMRSRYIQAYVILQLLIINIRTGMVNRF